MPYVTRATIRSLPSLGDPARFSDVEIDEAIAWFEETFEDHTGVAWLRRAVVDERHQLTVAAVIELNHPRPRSVSAVRSYSSASSWTAFTSTELADLHMSGTGVLRRMTGGLFTSGYGLVAVDYEHGHDAPPRDVVEAAKEAIRAHLLDDYAGNRQYALSTQEGVVRTSQPGPDRPFGIPSADAVANRRSVRGNCASVAIG